MSSPKEKARELVNKMFLQIPSVYDPTNLPHYPIAKQCALICIDEILNTDNDFIQTEAQQQYWQKVKNEINL
jgi:hypothetical protein